jgi:hypothetical protein
MVKAFKRDRGKNHAYREHGFEFVERLSSGCYGGDAKLQRGYVGIIHKLLTESSQTA